MRTFCAVAVLLAGAAWGQEQVVPLGKIGEVWTRDKGAGSSAVDESVRRDGRPSVRVEHKGEHDWSIGSGDRIKVAAGDVLELSAWIKKSGEGDASLCAIAYDDKGKAVNYALGRKSAAGAGDFVMVKTRLVIGPDVRTIYPRVIGHGVSTTWVEGITLKRVGNFESMRGNAPAAVEVENEILAVTFDTKKGTLAVKDKRCGRVWEQQSVHSEVIVTKASAGRDAINATLWHGPTDLMVEAKMELSGGEIRLTIAGDNKAEMDNTMPWPSPFVSGAGSYLVVPMNEGISYPVDDATIEPMRLNCYTGHGICMSFFGVTDGAAGQMAILGTPDDAQIQIGRQNGTLCIWPIWQAQKQRLGYTREIRYVFFDKGGHVAIAKRYRAHAKEVGLFKTLAEKRKDVPAIDKLVGAVNVWCWDKDAAGMVKELQAAGIDRILWSSAAKPDTLKALNELGVLTSRYDIYQDAMNPEHFPKLRGKHADWTSEGWPHHMMTDALGKFIPGWKVEAKDGTMIPCGVLCDSVAIPYAQKRIGDELKTHPYQCRFIDTTTASGWRECYSSDHPLTRTQSGVWKMKLLGVISKEFKLVCGSETGMEAAVPVCDFFEGMLSLGPYRVPDSGRKMNVIWDEVPAKVAKFQVGWQYRLPLWELVFHECCVAQWYWGDYNNKLPALWDKRDQFNALYATPGMFMFNRELWKKEKDRFIRSYKAWAPIVRAVGYVEMTDHRFLTADRSVQQTSFANGVSVIVNFGEKPFKMKNGKDLEPGGIGSAGVQ